MSIWNELQGVAFKQAFYEANGIVTRAIEAGEGEPLILLHGTGGHSEAYMRNIAEHAKHFHVYAIDLVGHGYSSMPDIDYGMQHYVDHLTAFLVAIGATKAHFSGESMGASVICWFALQHPDKVGKMVLNTGLPLAPPPGKPSEQLEALLERTRKATTGAPDLEAVKQRMQWLVLDPDKSLTEEIIQCRFQIYSQPGKAETIRKITEQSIGTLLDPAAKATWYNPDNLRKIAHPTLILWTSHNPGQPVALAERAAKEMPDARLAILQESAHWPQWEEAENFNRIHLKFLLA